MHFLPAKLFLLRSDFLPWAFYAYACTQQTTLPAASMPPATAATEAQHLAYQMEAGRSAPVAAANEPIKVKSCVILVSQEIHDPERKKQTNKERNAFSGALCSGPCELNEAASRRRRRLLYFLGLAIMWQFE